ncbi:MAG: hypothetical protein C4547_04310 [Phycisphaerales bacterium]|nr:MAG: hypothetical protein C4547_04310 [Phycisphaerales bacterium]
MIAGVLASAGIVEAGTLYTVRETGDILVAIDTNTLEFTDVGPLNEVFQFGGLEWDSSTDTLYAVDGRGTRSLHKIDPNTGQSGTVGAHGVTDLFGLGYDSQNDVLFACAFVPNQPLYTVNRSTGAVTPRGTIVPRLGNLAYNSRDDELLGVSDGAGDLYRIDRNTGEATLVFNGEFTDNSGLAYDPEQHVLWQIDWQGRLFKYDIANGYARTTVKTGLGSHDGLAFAGGGARCNYLIKKSKAKGGCETCPPKGAEFRSDAACEDVKECEKKLKGTIACPRGGNGTCKIKGKRRSCG